VPLRLGQLARHQLQPQVVLVKNDDTIGYVGGPVQVLEECWDALRSFQLVGGVQRALEPGLKALGSQSSVQVVYAVSTQCLCSVYAFTQCLLVYAVIPIA
jgi:hypothetical protein